MIDIDKPPSHQVAYHDRACYARAQRKFRPAPKNPIGQYMLERFRESGLSMETFARQHRTSRQILTDLFEDRLPLEEVYEELRREFGDELPSSPTETDRRRHAYPEVLKTYGHLGRTPEAIRKVADQRIGRQRAPDVGDAIRDAFDSSSKRLAYVERLQKQARSTEGRTVLTLTTFFRHHPEATDKQVRACLGMAAKRMDLCIAEVISIANPWLGSHGYRKLGGPRDANHCNAMRAYLSTNPRTYGMWTNPATPQTKEWCRDHARGCPALRQALAQTRGAKQ